MGKSAENPEPNLERAESCFQQRAGAQPRPPTCAESVCVVRDRSGARAECDGPTRLPRACGNRATRALRGARSGLSFLRTPRALHRRAPAVRATSIRHSPTGGYQAFWQFGDEEAARREPVNLCWLVDALIIGMRGDTDRAIEMLRDERRWTDGLARNLVREHARRVRRAPGRRDRERPSRLRCVPRSRDGLLRGAEHRLLRRAASASGAGAFARARLRALPRSPARRPVAGSVAADREFQFLVERSREAYRRCRKAYIDAGGERLLGPVPSPEELETRTPSPSPSA